MKLDYLIVGSGLAGSVFAQQCREKGKSCLIIEKNNHIAGNCYTEKIEGIHVHKFGPHIFKANNKSIWDYANIFSEFIPYFHKVKVNYEGKIYSMPINLQTLYEVYGVKTPKEAQEKLDQVKIKNIEINNLENWCLSQIGPELYEIFIKHYTTKQWRKEPKFLPNSIIKRLPVRNNFDDRWHQCVYSGIPKNGYTEWVNNILDGTKIELGVDFFNLDWKKYAKNLYFTGKIDQLFNYELGDLDYRSLRFEHNIYDYDFQGIAQVNYTDSKTKYTRSTEHKHFLNQETPKTVVSWEFPQKYTRDTVPYYPVNDDKNNALYENYKKLLKQNNVFGSGRLFSFRYMDMDSVLAQTLKKAEALLGN